MTNRQVRMLIIGIFLLLALLLPMAVLASPSNQPQIPHPLVGHEDCLSCHMVGSGVNGATPLTPDHAGRTDATCLGCHTLAASAQATATPTETATAAATETATPEATQQATESATAAATETTAATATATTTSGMPTTGGEVQVLAIAFVAAAIVLSGFGAKLLRE